MYGILGTRKGYLPFMPGACCTTFKGRENITKVAEMLTKEYKGNLLYDNEWSILSILKKNIVLPYVLGNINCIS